MVRRLAWADNSPLHFGLLDQCVFNFGHFDAIPVNLDPRVLASHEQERAVRCAAAQVAAAKCARAITGLRKPFGGQQFVAPITRRKIAALDDNFSDFAIAGFLAIFIQKQKVHSGRRPTHRQAAFGAAVISRETMLGDVAGFGRRK